MMWKVITDLAENGKEKDGISLCVKLVGLVA